MKYGIREICEVVLKAKGKMNVGKKIFYKNEPVITFDSLKTSTMEGAATTVYAQGGPGNARLIAWEGERTVTFTMEDALISTVSLAILTGADVIDATNEKTIKQHVTETIAVPAGGIIELENIPYMGDAKEDWIYVMLLKDGEPVSEPYLFERVDTGDTAKTPTKQIVIKGSDYAYDHTFAEGDIILVDYYTERSNGQQIDITPDKFGGNFYLEAATLFRGTDGIDYPAEFIIPNCKVQSNFTFTMAASGDPSTFTFTMDAFPDYTRFDKTKKVLSAIQVFGMGEEAEEKRYATDANPVLGEYDDNGKFTAATTKWDVNDSGDVDKDELTSIYGKTTSESSTKKYNEAPKEAE